MSIQAYVFKVEDEKVVQYLSTLVRKSRPIGELGNPFPLPDSKNLFFNPNNSRHPFPTGPLLLYTGWDLGQLEDAKSAIAAYLDEYPHNNGVQKHGKLDIETLFSEVLKYQGKYTYGSFSLQS